MNSPVNQVGKFMLQGCHGSGGYPCTRPAGSGVLDPVYDVGPDVFFVEEAHYLFL